MTHEHAQPDAAAPEADRPIIRLVRLEKRFGLQHVLKNLSIDFPRSATTVVLGPSGCGKSVTLKHVIGLLKPDSGEVWYERCRVDALSEAKLGPIRRDFGFLFQNGALFDSLSVRRNVAFPLAEHTKFTPEQRHERVRHVLGMVGLADAIEKMPADLSGGQRKRVALARAIVLEPKVILYDEPTTGLDPIRADVINELILKLQSELRTTSIVVTHDLTCAFKVADEMVMMHDGHAILKGTPHDFRSSDVPLVRRFLQGEASAEELAGITTELGALSSDGERGDEITSREVDAPAASFRAAEGSAS
jgi:phospholipid/cholesterol/gamma-HCH transport system ATP-binding protein